jgi:hypothetical protein
VVKERIESKLVEDRLLALGYLRLGSEVLATSADQRI